MGAVFADGAAREWPAPSDPAALARIEERRCKVRARMAEFAAIVRQPQRRDEALQLLLLIVHWVEGLYAAEDSLLPPGAHANAQRVAHRAVLRELHASVARLVSPDGGYEEFDLAHALDPLLIHECLGGSRTRARKQRTVTPAGNVTAAARGAERRPRLGGRPLAH